MTEEIEPVSPVGIPAYKECEYDCFYKMVRIPARIETIMYYDEKGHQEKVIQ
jgi:hypothetical protein